MSVWDTYDAQMGAEGRTSRERALKRAKFYINNKVRNSLSYHEVDIDGHTQNVTILDKKEDMAIKTICSMPGEALKHGGIVDFANSKWMITELDSNSEVYAKGKMQRCNYLLKWLNDAGDIIEKWCIVEDGTKYLIGEKTKDIMAIGDARIAITVAKDADTSELCRGKRFLVDDTSSKTPLAYQITKPNKLYNIYNDEGIFRFILNEVELTDNDNTELRIADYYNWRPKIDRDNEHKNPDIPLDKIISDAKNQPINDDDEKDVWI